MSQLPLHLDRANSSFWSSTSDFASKDSYFDAVRSFVPDSLVNHLCDNLEQELSTQPFSKFFEGICLIVDISGFTRLSGTFCSQGKLHLH
jgi:hypothetical protein